MTKKRLEPSGGASPDPTVTTVTSKKKKPRSKGAKNKDRKKSSRESSRESAISKGVAEQATPMSIAPTITSAIAPAMAAAGGGNDTETGDIAAHLPSRQLEDLLMEKSFNRKSIKQRVMMHHSGRLPESDKLANKIATVICDDMKDMVDADQAVVDILRDMTGTTISMKKRIREKVQSSSLRRKDSVALMPTWLKTKKYELFMRWQQLRYRMGDVVKYTTLWQSSVKKIEGQFGTGVASYFRFLRHLLFFNVPIFLLSFFFIIIPSILDIVSVKNETSVANFTGEEIILGDGYFTDTVMYYGFYRKFDISVLANMEYKMMYAYLFTSGTYYMLCLILLVTSMARSYRAVYVRGHYDVGVRLMERIFCGWQNGIISSYAAELHHRSVFNELKEYLAVLMKTEEEMELRERLKLWFMRFCTNVLIFLFIGLSAYLVYFVAEKQLDITTLKEGAGKIVMPVVVCLLFNAIPYAFTYIGTKEKYEKPETEVFIGMARTMLLKASVLCVLVHFWLFTMPCNVPPTITTTTSPQSSNASTQSMNSPQYNTTVNNTVILQINNTANQTYNKPITQTDVSLTNVTRDFQSSHERNISNSHENCIDCWETEMAQQIYRLVILDFIFIIATTFLLEFVAKHVQSIYTRKAAVLHFNIGRNTLEIIFSQALIWIGAFYSPLISFVMVIKIVFIFYFKRISASMNLKASDKPWVASRAQTAFLAFLSFFYAITLVSVAIGLIFVHPSKTCGLFVNKEYVYSIVTEIIAHWEEEQPFLHNSIKFITSPGFVSSVIVFLCIGNYFAWVIKNGHKEMVVSLKGRLTMEGRDKAYLMKRYREINYDIKVKKIARTAMTEEVSPLSTLRPNR